MKRLVLAAAVVVTIGCDRVTKHVATGALAGEPRRSYWADTVRLEYAENPGAFLGLGQHLPGWVRTGAFTVGTGLLLAALGLAAWRLCTSTRALFGLSLVLSGGACNLVDRIAYGRVVDFMNVGVGSNRTGIFNVADVAILLGVAVLVTARRR